MTSYQPHTTKQKIQTLPNHSYKKKKKEKKEKKALRLNNSTWLAYEFMNNEANFSMYQTKAYDISASHKWVVGYVLKLVRYVQSLSP